MYATDTTETSELVLRYGYRVANTHQALFAQELVSRGLRHERRAHWDTTAKDLDGLLEHATHSSRLGWGSAALLDLEEPECLAVVWLSQGVATVHLAADTLAALAERREAAAGAAARPGSRPMTRRCRSRSGRAARPGRSSRPGASMSRPGPRSAVTTRGRSASSSTL